MVENTFANNAYLVDSFAFAVDDFWHTLAQTPVMINTREPHVFIGEKAQLLQSCLGGNLPRSNICE
jgi:hypothetical protein